MKNFLILELIVLLLSAPAFSQYVRMPVEDAGPGNFGIKIGGGSSGFRGAEASYFQSATNYSFSIYGTLNYATGEHVEFSQDLGFNRKGAILKAFNKEIELKYIELDNFLKFKIKSDDSTPFIVTGFYVSVLINSESLEEISPVNPETGYQELSKRFDYGPFLGIGYDFGKPNKGVYERLFGIELRYSFGLADLFENKNHDLKNYAISAILRIFLFNL